LSGLPGDTLATQARWIRRGGADVAVYSSAADLPIGAERRALDHPRAAWPGIAIPAQQGANEVTEEIVRVDKEAARRKVRRAGRRVAEEVASKGREARRKVERVGKRTARAVSKRVTSKRDAVRRRAATAGKAAAAKLIDAGIEISRRQQAALEKLKNQL